MIHALEIAIGIWLGGLFFTGTVWAFMAMVEKASENRCYGRSWWRLWA